MIRMLLLLSTLLQYGVPFRLLNPNMELHDRFEPYDAGFVGAVGDPETVAPERVNEGVVSTRTQPRRWASAPGRQICPSMVGPLAQNRYYCRAKEYGYCDRRTGTCHCNVGYQGVDCSSCKPGHYKRGNLCYPKRPCPSAIGAGVTSQCSGAGTCNYTTGLCECYSHRASDDCSSPRCMTFDPLCIDCTEQGCTRCMQGYHFDETSLTCRECTRDYDPRCLSCDSEACLKCMDRELLSIRRSGPRASDPASFHNELKELAVTLLHGTQQTDYFDESEPFRVVSNASMRRPLFEETKRCDQGQMGSSAWNCSSIINNVNPAKHVVCGHEGTLSWSSSSYVVAEAARNVRLIVQRTGGGVGSVSVRYVLHHITTESDDLSPTAPYTLSTILQFEAGVTEISFLLTVHDDRFFEGDEMAIIELTSPRGGAALGPQRRATITISDDDSHRASAEYSKIVSDWGVVAGSLSNFVVFAYSGRAARMHTGADRFHVTLQPHFFSVPTKRNRDFHNIQLPYVGESGSFDAAISDIGNGTYIGWWNGTKVGAYKQRACLVGEGGLKGEYYSGTQTLNKPMLVRTDAQVNFHWEYPSWTAQDAFQIQTGLNAHFMRWAGRLRPSHDEPYFVYLSIRGDGLSARLWIEGRLVVDSWRAQNHPEAELKAVILLRAAYLHSIVLELRVSRHAQGCSLGGSRGDLSGCRKGISLEWSSSSTSRTTISPEFLYCRFFMRHSVSLILSWRNILKDIGIMSTNSAIHLLSFK